MGEVAWVGSGSLGRDDGRVVLYRPGLEALRHGASAGAGGDGSGHGAGGGSGSDGSDATPESEIASRLRDRLRRRGALFYRELAPAVGQATEREVLDALWDLVWAGEITNDTFAPLRALRWRRPSGERRPRPGRMRMAPPEAVGRWSLIDSGGVPNAGAAPDSGGVPNAGAVPYGNAARAVPDGNATPAAPAAPAAPATETARLHSLAVALLDRYGVLTREAVVSEGVPGGFSAIYPVLRAMEESGRVRRGYFVDGLGAAQFALPGAVDRLRVHRGAAAPDPGSHRYSDTGRDPDIFVLAAADPASPYGAAIPWPRKDGDRRSLQRATGAYVVIVDGEAALYLERGGHSIVTLPATGEPSTAASAFAALRSLVADGRFRELAIVRVDGIAVAASPWREVMESADFTAGYRGYVLRSSSAPTSTRS
jgi:ATP-dependent Lhr-like helicase